MTEIRRRLVGTVGGRIAGTKIPAVCSCWALFSAASGECKLRQIIGESEGIKFN